MKLILTIISVSLVVVLLGFINRRTEHVGVDRAIRYFKEASVCFAKSTSNLESAIRILNNKEPATIRNAREALKESRFQYKKIEFFLTYFFPQAALAYNSPAKVEVELPEMEYREPVGFQVIESLLYDDNVESSKTALLQQCEVIGTSAYDLPSLLYRFNTGDKQILESIRLELIRVTTLNIAGFDAPLLKTGLTESVASLESIEYCIAPYETFGPDFDSVAFYLRRSITLLKNAKDFDAFNRLHFLTACALPLQKHLNRFLFNNQLNINAADVWMDSEKSFAANILTLPSFANGHGNEERVALGRRLFSEKLLSGNSLTSCETCHQPTKYFSDGLAKSIAFDQRSTVTRNAPSLLYARFQNAQFWDARAVTLEDQVMDVIKSRVEMNGNYDTIVNRLKRIPEYRHLFSSAFRSDRKESITIDNVSIALADFIRQLNPMNSAFDRYVNGDETTLSGEQVNGFNLFMGKAQCGTCHFSPFFNGLLPPYFDMTEVEVLGVPASSDFARPLADTDSGLYHIYPTPYLAGAFKTPTLRNAALTAPYMHNGALKTLEQVVDFYNRGGGVGIGLPVTSQTLSSKPLNLNEQEVKQIVSFLESLTDSLETVRLHHKEK